MPGTVALSRAKAIAADHNLSWPPSEGAIQTAIRQAVQAQNFRAVDELRRLLRYLRR
jgi:D-aminopeptidase